MTCWFVPLLNELAEMDERSEWPTVTATEQVNRGTVRKWSFLFKVHLFQCTLLRPQKEVYTTQVCTPISIGVWHECTFMGAHVHIVNLTFLGWKAFYFKLIRGFFFLVW